MQSKGPSELEKIVHISDELCRLNLTPKEFIAGFLTREHPQLVYRRRSWATQWGWTSTMNLVESIRNLFLNTQAGSDRWTEFIQAESIRILRAQSPPRGYYPGGSFQSAVTVIPGFFSDKAMDERKARLTTHDTPFLYNILIGTLARPGDESFTPEEMEAENPPDIDVNLDDPDRHDFDRTLDLTSDEAEQLEYEGDVYSTATPKINDRQARSAQTAAVICSMMAFSRNRRQNGLQLANSIRFVACGVSETVNEYLHYMGLTSSRKTALVALQSLARAAANNIVNSMAIINRLAPPLCIDNLDMEERVHLATVGTQNRMFHGTWGYIHVPSKGLFDSLDASQLTLEAYHDSLRPVADDDNYEWVWKSQLAKVMLKYVAIPATRTGRLSLEPPIVEQVMEALQRQSGLGPEEFFGRLQLIDGDLGTAQIFNAIRSLRSPSEHPEHHLNNVTFSLGASHTLWNIAQTILTKHFGNSNKMDDLGVWRYLDALGISPDKVLQKKDFTKMIHAMEHVHEVTLHHCLRVVMECDEDPLQESLPVISTPTWNSVIEQCYDRFCSPAARKAASKREHPKLSNLLVRLQDFSTVVEAHRAMKAGDVGRLINIWKMCTNAHSHLAK
ncbi:uncharacterized protein PGTG_22743 [Puccinia graminis f. sp. tritici CRL 75-36-700-3]|uniref:DUF6589 domain-containing protein n=1 Tax=Puccinia graminis f. sp. tritici (strain CRL 75-36-700-3 / race SCCL) TaxID=418459 RepID=H6QVG2_PUCGT|nr:uncharacterized protein PGTG_22743 [Puccinia graminis f. sp. tritici CRL 75-36-700-3]EHS62945.1 hypothetical protein PGTG_22743 [Puccinia graminis f. sp. tritici CRL 75-36-700-3]